jgi:fluoroquinolone resistance protein
LELELKFTPEASFENEEFKGIDFTHHQLKSVEFYHCKFTNCNLANQSLINASFQEPVFDSCKLLGINWCAVKRLGQPKFLNSKLDLSIFNRMKLKKAEFINCSMKDVDLSEADLSSGIFTDSILSNSNFDGAIITGTDFRNSKDYFIDPRKTKIKGAKFSYPDVLSLITALGAEVDF